MRYVIFFALLFSSFLTFAQHSSPYEWNWAMDGIWLGAGFGGSVYGVILIQNKEGISAENLQTIDRNDISRINRWSAGYSSESASKISDIPFALSFAVPFTLLFSDDINAHTGQYIGMYLEGLSTTAALFSITAGLVDKSRPYVYDEDLEMDRRLSTTGQRSFYSGHVAAAATATFFAAKVYTDYHPDTKGKLYIWTAAAVVPAAVGYYRLKAGQHFLTDVMLGYVLGAATGILVPELHKKKDVPFKVRSSINQNFLGEEYAGLSLSYTF